MCRLVLDLGAAGKVLVRRGRCNPCGCVRPWRLSSGRYVWLDIMNPQSPAFEHGATQEPDSGPGDEGDDHAATLQTWDGRENLPVLRGRS